MFGWENPRMELYKWTLGSLIFFGVCMPLFIAFMMWVDFDGNNASLLGAIVALILLMLLVGFSGQVADSVGALIFEE